VVEALNQVEAVQLLPLYGSVSRRDYDCCVCLPRSLSDESRIGSNPIPPILLFFRFYKKTAKGFCSRLREQYRTVYLLTHFGNILS
jgi:hypothetical protein